MEAAVASKIGGLRRAKEAADFKVQALQKSLGESVPSATLEAANRQLSEVTANYR